MHLFKFNLFVILLLNSSLGLAFTGTECVQESFDVSVSHKGWPFGLFITKLDIKKNNCEVEIGHRQLKYLSKSWLIDICREPVHIKENTTSIEVIKKLSSCKGRTSGEFCSTYNEMMTILQDDGLIFAEGEKEDLSSNHGKTYCTYQLLKGYLSRDVIFNRHKQYANLSAINGTHQTSGEHPISMSDSIEDKQINEAPRPEVFDQKVPEASHELSNDSETDTTAGRGSF